MRQITLLTFQNLQSVAYLGAKVESDAHTLRDSQAQQNFHAIELPNIPPSSCFSLCCVRVCVFGCACVCAVVCWGGGGGGGIINGGRHGHRFR